MKLISQGAEARIYESNYLGRKCIIKERFSKDYRILELDQKITLKRTNQEAKLLFKCNNENIVNTPQIYHVEWNKIYMEHIEQSQTLKHYLWNCKEYNQECLDLLKRIGTIIYTLHQKKMIHGDLTSSNILLQNDQIYLIDFGLAYIMSGSQMEEDCAVDLYVMERALLSSHLHSQILMDSLLLGYPNKNVLQRLDQVRQRGRKRNMVG